MRVLVTSSRMPFALDEIRKLGDAGHEVFAADTFRTAPGSHARAVREHHQIPSPRSETDAFVEAICSICERHGIDRLLPQFEEVFYLAKHRDRLPRDVTCFFAPFETLARFHDKASFQRLCAEVGAPSPRTIVARSQPELRDACDELGAFFARAAFSRGGVELLTNRGPLAGAVALDDCHPTDTNPWLVQEYVTGEDLCSYSVAHDGEVALHLTYRHPKTIEHAGGIVFESVEEPRTLDLVRRFCRATDYTGQISFDFLRDASGQLQMVECNPRPTDGVTLLAAPRFDGALFEPPAGEPYVLPAGHRTQIDLALVRDMVRNWHEIPADVAALFQGHDIYSGSHDHLPALYQLLSYTHVLAYRHEAPTLHPGTGAHRHTDIMAAQFHDISWDGQPIR